LLRSRGEGKHHRRPAEQGDKFASLQFVEWHLVQRQVGLQDIEAATSSQRVSPAL
jgi:hypothetical protein